MRNRVASARFCGAERTGDDGHGEHQGAWPMDIWYGDMDVLWADSANHSNCDSSRLGFGGKFTCHGLWTPAARKRVNDTNTVSFPRSGAGREPHRNPTYSQRWTRQEGPGALMHIEAGAGLKGSTNLANYQLDGVRRGFVFARDEGNIENLLFQNITIQSRLHEEGGPRWVARHRTALDDL
ncbi:MAG: hypothetical protein GX456_10445 [Verrucomicrobia bacterium]|nr:hypothetical protein [Verrucomicrobiota bacterium]